MKEDEIIESFFKGMKKKEESLSVPVFPKQIRLHRKRQWPVFLYAGAAVATIIIALLLIVKKNEDPVREEQLVILIGQDDKKTNSLIEEESLSEWNSPTDFLAEDF